MKFILLHFITFFFFDYFVYGKNLFYRNLQNSFAVDYEYNTCQVINCGDELCSTSPNAICKFDKEINKKRCFCNDGFITYKTDELFLCCYIQKSATMAIILELFFGFGIGHFYLGNYIMGIFKASIYSIFCCSNCIILFKFCRSESRFNENKSFLFKVTSTTCLMMGSCIYIIWQIVDLILFSIGGYNDGNGAPLYINL